MPDQLNRLIWQAWETFVYLSVVAVVVMTGAVAYLMWSSV